MSFRNLYSQPKVLLMRWGITGGRLQAFLVAFIFLVFFTIYQIFHIFAWPSIEGRASMNRHSEFYCNKPGPVFGKEGKLPFIKNPGHNYELLQVQMVIRHGDRAPIVLNTLPNTAPVEISCNFNSSWSDYSELNKIRKDSSMFELTGNPSMEVIQERKICEGGQLTPTGFLQHIYNGKHLKKVYADILETITDPRDILAMATDYSRTVQSAAALLYGMFGHKFLTQKLQIHVQKDQYPATHFLKDETDEPISCRILVKRLKDIWQLNELIELRKLINPVKKEFAALFDTERSNIASLDRVVDIMYTRLCHGQPLPEGPNGKVPYKLASHSFQLSHQFITVKHSPLAELQTLAILSRIVFQAANLIEAKETYKQKLVIFSGHDTVLVPFLALLGVHDKKWPPYASKVVIELWRDSSSKTTNTDPNNVYQIFENHFFRVLYNGVPLTSQVKFCIGKTVNVELCPVTEFIRYVSGNEFSGKNFFKRIQNLCSV